MKRSVYYLFLMVPLMMLNQGCGDARNRRTERKDLLSTSKSGRLFFKNVREFYYDKSELPGNRHVTVYRMSRCQDDVEEAAYFNLTIADNYRDERAILLLEPNGVLSKMQLKKVVWNNDEQELAWPVDGPLANYHFAASVDSLLKAGKRLFVRGKQDRKPLFQQDLDRECFQQQFHDYERLISRK